MIKASVLGGDERCGGKLESDWDMGSVTAKGSLSLPKMETET